MQLIVDGYNLARSGAFPLSADASSEEGRADLCALVAAYSRAKGFRLTVVFDGRGAGSPDQRRMAFKGGTAIFSARSETADDVIRDLARRAPAGTVVVTSDRGLAGTLASRNVTAVSCDEFGGRLLAHGLEEVKGAADDEPDRPAGKRGEGHKPKKKERVRSRVLKKL